MTVRTPHIQAMLRDALNHAEKAMMMGEGETAVGHLVRASVLATHASAELEDEICRARTPHLLLGEESYRAGSPFGRPREASSGLSRASGRMA